MENHVLQAVPDPQNPVKQWIKRLLRLDKQQHLKSGLRVYSKNEGP
jgi:hypothetical protein